MHFIIIAAAIGLAWSIRALPLPKIGTWASRWQRSLFTFLFAPLLLLMTATAVILMGYHGKMFGLPAGWFSYCLSLLFMSWAGIKLLRLIYQAEKSLQKIATYSQQTIAGETARILDIPFPYSAQIGFWQPQLVVSQGLLNLLDTEHIDAVIAHEKAHANYWDTFWFFWLGWMRSFTLWLPNTETLWQELLLLREMRADRQAAQYVDPLLLAESLLIVTQNIHNLSPFKLEEGVCAAFHDTLSNSRLNERIEALLNNPSEGLSFNTWYLLTLIALALIPLVLIPLHY